MIGWSRIKTELSHQLFVRVTITGKDVELGWGGALLGRLEEGGGVGPELLHHHHRLLRVHCRGGQVQRHRLGKGQSHEILYFRFFSLSFSSHVPGPLTIAPFRVLSKICEDILNSRLITGFNDTSG